MRRLMDGRRGRRSRLARLLPEACVVAAALSLHCFPACGEALGDKVEQPAPSIQLYLDVSINGMPRGIVPFELRSDVLWIRSAELKRLGFRLGEAQAETVRLDSLSLMTFDFNAMLQTIRLDAPLSSLSLPTTVLEAQERAPDSQAEGGSGVLLNYDIYGTKVDGAAAALSAQTELRGFAGNTVFSHTMLSRLSSGGNDGQRPQHRRLDTTWSRSFPRDAVTLRVGDMFSGSLPWTRATRMGGVQLARNFSLQPYLATAPLPSYLGSAVLPSALELYVNGVRQYIGQVPAGPFRLNGLPSLNASGTAEVVLTDALGRTSTIAFPLYDAGRLLGPGLSDWSLEAGFVRRGYGLRSFDYDREIALSGSWRRGLTPQFTIEAHAEATRDVRMVGTGGVWQAGASGLVSASLSQSNHAGGSGRQASLAYTWMRAGFTASFSGTRTHGEFRDVASRHGAAPAASSARATIGYGAAGIGSFSLSYFHLRNREEPASRMASFNWLVPLSRSLSLSVGVARDLSRSNARGVSLNLNWDLDGARSMSVGVQTDAGRNKFSAEAHRSEPSEGGWSWRTSAELGSTGSGRAEVAYAGAYGRLGAGVAVLGTRKEGFASASGSLLYMDGRLFSARRLDNSFAIVSSDGMADVPVRLENRLVGATDAQGKLLVSPLNPYQKNLLSIDPMRLPADVRVERTQAYAMPPDRGGSLVRFALIKVRAAVVVLTNATGAPLPVGTQVHLNGSQESLTLGYDGELYLEGLRSMDNELSVHASGGTCRARFHRPQSASGIARIGPIRCMSQPGLP